MGRNMDTSQVKLARFIANKELLGYVVDGKYKPLKFSTIINYISTIVNEDKNVKKIIERAGKQRKKKKE